MGTAALPRLSGQWIFLLPLQHPGPQPAAGTIPGVVFGGRRLWRRLCRSAGPEHARLRTQWHAAWQGGLYSRGDAPKGGNPNLRLGLQPDGGFTSPAAISHLSEKRGTARGLAP